MSVLLALSYHFVFGGRSGGIIMPILALCYHFLGSIIMPDLACYQLDSLQIKQNILHKLPLSATVVPLLIRPSLL
jgi:hypothetical protein